MRFGLRTATLSVLCVAIWPALVSVGQQPAYANTALHRRHITYTMWSSDRAFTAGIRSGVTVGDGGLRIGWPAGSLAYTDPYGNGDARSYDWRVDVAVVLAGVRPDPAHRIVERSDTARHLDLGPSAGAQPTRQDVELGHAGPLGGA